MYPGQKNHFSTFRRLIADARLLTALYLYYFPAEIDSGRLRCERWCVKKKKKKREKKTDFRFNKCGAFDASKHVACHLYMRRRFGYVISASLLRMHDGQNTHCLFSLACWNSEWKKVESNRDTRLGFSSFCDIILAVNLSLVLFGPFHSKPLLRNLILFVSSMSTPFARHTSTFPIKYSIHNLFFLPPPGIALVRKELRRWKASKRYESRTNSITFLEQGIRAKKKRFSGSIQ